MNLQDYFIYINPISTNGIISLIDNILKNHNLSIKANSSFYFGLSDYEIGDEEFNFKTKNITNSQEDLDKLKHNPAGGWITYLYQNTKVLVGFDMNDCSLYLLDTISISIYYNEYILHQHFIDNLIKTIHIESDAIRTIGGENISEDVDIVKNELNNTKKGLSKNKYTIDWIGI
jgi:hypothetical protein